MGIKRHKPEEIVKKQRASLRRVFYSIATTAISRKQSFTE